MTIANWFDNQNEKLAALVSRNVKLEAVVEAAKMAPHHVDCAWEFTMGVDPCDCYKAPIVKALKALEVADDT